MASPAVPLRVARTGSLKPVWAAAAVLFLLAALLTGAVVGPAHLGVGGGLRSLLAHVGIPGIPTGPSEPDETILWQIRPPRVVVGALVGAMLATAGASYQGVFRNPLADPYLLGVAAGAGLGATLAVAYTPSRALLPPAAFIGGSIAVGATYALGRSSGRGRAGGALLVG